MTKRLVVFNHKGGVSKTTTVYNLGCMLAENHKVLLVDADPQCNLTSLVLYRENEFEKYYTEDSTKKLNIKDGVAPAFLGKPSPIAAIDCPSSDRLNNLFLLPGHADLSALESSLGLAQTSGSAITALQNLPGSFHELIRLCEEKYSIDYTLVDLNPGLGAINQNIFLNCDAFAIPTNPDPFSINAIETLEMMLPRWAAWKEDVFAYFKDSAYPLREGVPKFIGTLIQRFNVRNGAPAKPYRENIEEIKKVTSEKLFPILSKSKMTLSEAQYPEEILNSSFCLAEIPDFGGLLPKSRKAGVPVFVLSDNEIKENGVILESLKEKRDQLQDQFKTLTQMIISLLSNV